MADELDLDLDLEEDINSKVKQRIDTALSKRDEAQKLASEKEAEAQKALEEKAQIEKERDFYASFSDSTAKYPNAHEFKDSIKEKVMSGYSVEDATVAVLAKEGKLTVESTPKEVISPMGGSAQINIPSGEKSIQEMTREEKRAALMEAEKRGDLYLS